MSDQTTISSFEDSLSQINVNANLTTNTTPPIGDYHGNNSSFGNTTSRQSNSTSSIVAPSSSSIPVTDVNFNTLPNVLSSLNLDENTIFKNATAPTTATATSTNTNTTNTPPINWTSNPTNPSSNSYNGFSVMQDLPVNVGHISSTSKHQHTASSASGNSSLKDENYDSSFNNGNTSAMRIADENNANRNSFILPDSYLFEQPITNTPNSSVLSPNKTRTATFTTPVLGETSRRLNYNLASPNNQGINQLNAQSMGNEALGMGIAPGILNPNDPSSIFSNCMPNQFGFPNNTSTPPLNGLPTGLMNPNQPALNLFNAGFPQQVINNGYPQHILQQNYSFENGTNPNIIRPSGIEPNFSGTTPNNGAANTKGNNVNNNNSSNNNNNNGNLLSHRSNLGINSTANVHRKHSSNNKRGEDAARFVNATLNDFINEIYYLCKDQHGCRFLQRQLELNSELAATKIFNEIQLNVIELMIDPFGNYLIQKLLERVDESQRTTLVRNASSQFVRIALDPHGTRALQKLVECISTETEYKIIINSLSSYVVLLSRDLNGNHVIQKCLQKLPPNYCDFIFEAACENCVKIAKHRHGCCVLQRCFDHGTPKQCEQLSLKVGENAVELSIDPYGNYVVQYVLSMEENRLRLQNDPSSATKIPDTSKSIDLIISSLANNLTKLSTHKFGSNVIEKSLRIPTLSPILIKQLLSHPESLKLLLHDAYGNYVLQTSLDVADDSSFKELSEQLKPYLSDVRNTPHGRRILSKLISRGGNAAILNANLGENFSLESLEQPNNHNNGHRRHHNNNNNHYYHHNHNNNNNNYSHSQNQNHHHHNNNNTGNYNLGYNSGSGYNNKSW
ncbi:hypothetical protein JL09_g1919 [Pichia kudriavzevii]|uniref:PUM-HD domain-containing protein n=1 Tax=Pichia kudriavzevii TaxID=4909 RepID=A0A099P416_PICKU|nr:hypothetical protein JL09_g1919 [Pichia kudriavzevii]